MGGLISVVGIIWNHGVCACMCGHLSPLFLHLDVVHIQCPMFRISQSSPVSQLVARDYQPTVQTSLRSLIQPCYIRVRDIDRYGVRGVDRSRCKKNVPMSIEIDFTWSTIGDMCASHWSRWDFIVGYSVLDELAWRRCSFYSKGYMNVLCILQMPRPNPFLFPHSNSFAFL